MLGFWFSSCTWTKSKQATWLKTGYELKTRRRPKAESQENSIVDRKPLFLDAINTVLVSVNPDFWEAHLH